MNDGPMISKNSAVILTNLVFTLNYKKLKTLTKFSENFSLYIPATSLNWIIKRGPLSRIRKY